MKILFRFNFGIDRNEINSINHTMLDKYLAILRGLQITADSADEASVAVSRGDLVVQCPPDITLMTAVLFTCRKQSTMPGIQLLPVTFRIDIMTKVYR